MNTEQDDSNRPDQASEQIGIDQSRLVGATEGIPSGPNSLPEAQDARGPLEDVNFTVADDSTHGGPRTPTPPVDVGHGENGPKKLSKRGFLYIAGSAVAAVGLGAVGIGIGKKEGGDGPIVIANPATKVPIATEQAKDTPTEEPKPTRVPPISDPDAGGKEGPIESDTPTPESTVEKYPFELGKSFEFGNTTFTLTKKLQEDGSDSRFSGSGGGTINEIWLNTEDYPDAEERLNEGIMYGQFLSWQSETGGRDDVTFENFKERVESGEDMSFTLFGFEGKALLDYGEITVDPAKPVHVILLSNSSAGITPFAGDNMGFRTIDGELYIEMHNSKSFNVDDNSEYNHQTYGLVFRLAWALSLMSDREGQEKRSLSVDEINDHLSKLDDINAYFIPDRPEGPEIYWNSIMRHK